MNSKTSYRVGECNVCGYERDSKPSHTRNAISVSYISIPSKASPRKGVKQLAENAGIPIEDAADVLNPNTNTSLSDVSDN